MQIEFSEKTMPNLSIVGITRFSIDPLSIIDQTMGIEDMERRQKAVYLPERLISRLHLFKSFALPSIVAAATTTDGFFHLIAYSSQLPQNIKSMLMETIEEHKTWLIPVEISPAERFTDIIRKKLFSLTTDQFIFNFRIDDDDALCPDFVDEVYRLAESHKEGEVVSFDKGYYVQKVSDDGFVIQETNYPKIAIGLGVFCGNIFRESVFDRPVHRGIPDDVVTNVIDKQYWIRTIHTQNDSGTRARPDEIISIDAACKLLSPRFSYLSLHEVLRGLPTTSGHVRASNADHVLFRIQ